MRVSLRARVAAALGVSFLLLGAVCAISYRSLVRFEEAKNLAEARAAVERTSRIVILITVAGMAMKLAWVAIIDRAIGQSEKAKDALVESGKRMAFALEAVQMGAWEMDLQGARTVRTLRHDQIFGYETLQADWGLDRFMKEHADPAHHPLIKAAFESVYATGTFHLECPITRKDGAPRWIRAEGKLYRDALGAPARIVGVVMDVTEDKEKTASLTRALAQAERVNKELESFSYSVSHDLRAPLRAIDGFSQAVLEDSAGVLSAESASDLARVRAASQRMAMLIDDMLELAHVSRVVMRPARVDMSALAEAEFKELASAHPGRRVTFSAQPGLAADGDEGLIRLVMTNLLGNAWKFTSKTPGARIEFSEVLQPDGAAYRVRDNGAGFDPVYGHKLFGAFQRLHTEDEFPGTGVGLATVLRAVNRHGGRAWAESAVGEGASFYFTIPKTPGGTHEHG